MISLFTIIQYSAQRLNESSRTTEKYKIMKILKEKFKLFVFSDVIFVCLKDPTDSSRKLVDSMNVYNEVAGYKHL